MSARPARRRHRCVPAATLAALAVTLALGAGCAADRHAQQFALRVLQETATYEKTVDDKVAAEKRFYRDQLAVIRHRLDGHAEIVESPSSGRADDQDRTAADETMKTMLYGRIRASALREARITAGQILAADAGHVMSQIMSYINHGVRDDHDFYLKTLERQRQLTENLVTSLAAVDQQKARLQAIRQELTALASDPSLSSQLDTFAAIAKAIADQVEKTP